MTSTANYNSNSNSGTVADATLERKVKEIEESLKHDKSQANVIAQFAKVIEIEGVDTMASVIDIVNSMGEGWRNIMKDEKELTKLIKRKEMLKLKSIRHEYFTLLLKTNVVIAGMVEESEMQKENVDDALRVVNTALYKGEEKLSKSDRLVFKESIQDLMDWIDQSELVEITEEWNALCQKLEEQKSVIEQIASNMRDAAATAAQKLKDSSFFTKCLCGIGAVIAFGAAVCLTVVTFGAAAGVLVACACVGAAWGGYWVGTKLRKPIDTRMAQRIGQITSLLEKYIKTCKVMAFEVNAMSVTEKQMEKRAKRIFKKTACETMLKGLTSIGEYLDTYMEQGEELVSVIKKSCAEFINN